MLQYAKDKRAQERARQRKREQAIRQRIVRQELTASLREAEDTLHWSKKGRDQLKQDRVLLRQAVDNDLGQQRHTG